MELNRGSCRRSAIVTVFVWSPLVFGIIRFFFPFIFPSFSYLFTFGFSVLVTIFPYGSKPAKPIDQPNPLIQLDSISIQWPKRQVGTRNLWRIFCEMNHRDEKLKSRGIWRNLCCCNRGTESVVYNATAELVAAVSVWLAARKVGCHQSVPPRPSRGHVLSQSSGAIFKLVRLALIGPLLSLLWRHHCESEASRGWRSSR